MRVYICLNLSNFTLNMCVCVFSHSIVSDSLQPYGLYPPRLLCPWDAPGKDATSISYSRESFQPRDQTCISWVSCIGRQILYLCATLGSPQLLYIWIQQRRQENLRDWAQNCVCQSWALAAHPRREFVQDTSEQDLAPRVTRTPCLPSKVRPGAFSTA